MATPGVTIEEIVKLPPSVAPVATAIPAFIGYTQQATDSNGTPLTGEPKRIVSLAEYERFYGNAPAHEVKVTFTPANAAGDPPTIALTDFDELPADGSYLYYCLRHYFANGGGPCWIVSVGDGTNTARAHFDGALTRLETIDEATLILYPDALALGADYFGVASAALVHCNKMQDRFTICDVPGAVRSEANPFGLATTFRGGATGTKDELKYGASYFPFLETQIPFVLDDDSVTVTVGGADKTLTEVATESQEDYNQIRKFLQANARATLPASPAVAGIYAKVDRQRGVFKAPANVPLSMVKRPSIDMTNDLNGRLNVDPGSGKSINVVRTFTGKGTLVWGSRTLAGSDNEWRYVPVRRFFNFVEESVKKATEPFVFEPNDANTWVRVRAMIENFLILQWRDGALAGSKPEQAFYVKVGLGETMTAQDILEGRLIVEIGMAAVRPAEFIILRFAHKLQEA